MFYLSIYMYSIFLSTKFFVQAIAHPPTFTFLFLLIWIKTINFSLLYTVTLLEKG